MAVGSNVNPNFPIPGLDQNSKGFRDNFAIIKREIEQIQGTTLQFTGAVIGGPVTFGDTNSIVIPTAVNGAIVALDPPLNAIQYNKNGFLKGDTNFVYDQDLISVGIGTSVKTDYSLCTGNSVQVGNLLAVVTTVASASANVVIGTTTSNVTVSNLNSSAQISIDKPLALDIRNSDTNLLYLTPTANIGIGVETPTAAFHLLSNIKDIGRIYTNPQLSDSIFRLVTADATSTIGFGLEHRAFGWLGGLRIDEKGTISVHSGESQDAYLSSASARITIDSAGSVGIGVYNPAYTLDINGTLKSKGILDTSDDVIKLVGINNNAPVYTLDVIGDIATTGTIINLPRSTITIDPNPLLVDTWPISVYRTARYTLQAVFGSPETVHVFEFVCFHADSEAKLMPISDLSSGLGLGTITTAVNGIFFEVYFTAANVGTTVSTSKSYIQL